MSGLPGNFQGPRRVSDQAVDAAVVTPDDDADLAQIAVAIEARADGLVRVTTAAGTTLELFFLRGVPKPLLVRRVHDTGTDSAVKAAGIVALF